MEKVVKKCGVARKRCKCLPEGRADLLFHAFRGPQRRMVTVVRIYGDPRSGDELYVDMRSLLKAVFAEKISWKQDSAEGRVPGIRYFRPDEEGNCEVDAVLEACRNETPAGKWQNPATGRGGPSGLLDVEAAQQWLGGKADQEAARMLRAFGLAVATVREAGGAREQDLPAPSFNILNFSGPEPETLLWGCRDFLVPIPGLQGDEASLRRAARYVSKAELLGTTVLASDEDRRRIEEGRRLFGKEETRKLKEERRRDLSRFTALLLKGEDDPFSDSLGIWGDMPGNCDSLNAGELWLPLGLAREFQRWCGRVDREEFNSYAEHRPLDKKLWSQLEAESRRLAGILKEHMGEGVSVSNATFGRAAQEAAGTETIL